MRLTVRFGWGVLGIALFAAAALSQDRVTVSATLVGYPSLIVHNGKIVTMDDESTTTRLGTIVQAMAIRGKEILAIGTNAEMLELAGPNTERIDLKGRTVIPGIVDSHTHIHNGALNEWASEHPEVLEQFSRRFVIPGNTNAEIYKGIEVALKENMANEPPGKWAFLNLNANEGGSGMGQGVKFVQDHAMKAEDLNKMSTKNPVFIAAHPAYMINDAARKAIKDLYGFEPLIGEGEEMDENQQGGLVLYGRGLVVDGYFNDRIPELSKIVHDALLANAAIGITTFTSHMMGLRFMDAYRYLEARNQLPIRFAYTHYFGFQDNPDPANFYRRLGDTAGMGSSDYFWTTGVGVGNIDDGPPMFCSSMEAPQEIKKREYCKNAPGTSQGAGIYAAIISHQRVSLGHAYADKGVDYFLDQIEQAMKEFPGTFTLAYVRSKRYSSDHCGFYPRPDQIPRMARLGYYVSCGGNVLDRSYPWLKLYGLDRYQSWIAPIRSLVEGGVRVMYENEAGVDVSDKTGRTYFNDVVPLITRRNHAGQMVAPDQGVDRNILMKMMTVWPSYYMLKEDKIGTLAPGKWADFLVLNKDYFTVEPVEEIANTYPYMTVVGGKITFIHSDYAPEIGRQPVGIQIKYDNSPRYESGG
jgi:predicted amidohydrolase YtcJ